MKSNDDIPKSVIQDHTPTNLSISYFDEFSRIEIGNSSLISIDELHFLIKKLLELSFVDLPFIICKFNKVEELGLDIQVFLYIFIHLE